MKKLLIAFIIGTVVFVYAASAATVTHAADANNRPNAETTGPTGTLTPQSGNKTLGNGQTLENVELSGCITVTGSNVTIKNVKVNCSSGTSSINIASNSSDVTVEKVEAVRPTANAVSMFIGAASNVTVRAVDMSNGGDVIMIHSVNGLTIEDSYLHDPKLAGNGHVDVVQIVGGKNITIRNNTITMSVGAAGSGAYVANILAKADLGAIDNVLIENNYFSGGQFSVYTMAGNNSCNVNSTGQFPAPTNMKIQFNTFSGTNGVLPLVANPGAGQVINCNKLPSGALIQYRKYDKPTCDGATYTSTCTGTQPTTAPTVQPTANPTTAPSCPKKTLGDADCNGMISITDYAAWRAEFKGTATTKNGDFNGDGNVSLADYAAWKTTFTSGV